MSDLYFFKKIRQAQWLGLRLPENLRLDMDEDGLLRPMQPWSYVDVSPLPEWAAAARVLVLNLDHGVVKPVLVATSGKELGWQPFQRSRATLAVPPVLKEVQDLAEAMGKAIANPLLPLRLYQAYRDFPAKSKIANYASDEEVRLALIRAVGGSATNQPVEAYSELLFIVDSVDGPPAPAVNVDVDDDGPARLRVTAHQSAPGVTLQLEHREKRVTNGSVVPMIQSHGGVESQFAPFYRWRRTLGMAERPSAESGAILIPTDVTSMTAGVLDSATWAARPFRVTDRLGTQQLAGELLNYEVGLFNPHGRCTHVGRVLLKRQRLDPPLPPLRGNAQLLPPEKGSDQARCTITFAFAADQPDPLELKTVVYCQDYPVVPTGFYGDDDDQALTVARSLGDLGGEMFAGGQLIGDVEYDGETLPNLSSHNLSILDMQNLKETKTESDGQLLRRVEFTMALAPGRAIRLFLALRREVEGGDSSPESPVVALQHLTGPGVDAIRTVPHFERFWGPLHEPVWLGEGAARVMEVEGQQGARAKVRIVIQHASADAPGDGELTGGYRLWMRDVAAPGEQTPFNAVALVQAVPPLVKAYAPIEVGRNWTVIKDKEPRASSDSILQPQVELPQHDFILPSEPALPGAQVTGATERTASEEAQRTGLKSAIDAARQLGGENLDASLILGAMQKLRGMGTARECLLSVTKRRAMTQNLVQPPGNWVFFYDQLGNLMGRAIQFWLPKEHDIEAEKLPYSQYRLTEQPSAQDAVALDDFGRMVWTWDGLGDLWRHELEWVIEAVPRYAPIQGLRKALGLETDNEIMTVRRSGHGQWHRLVVARRAPFTARFGLAQVLDAADDAFVIALDAPHEFRQSLYNSVARTRQGVLRMHAASAQIKFRHAQAYDGVGENLLTAWLGGENGSTTARPPKMQSGMSGSAPVGAYGELVYDEPPCMELIVRVGASADDVHNPEPVSIGPLTRRRMHKPAKPPSGLVVKRDDPHIQIEIPLARLDWFYSGNSWPAIGQFPGIVALQPFGQLSLLRLPDPEAELLLFFKFGNMPLRQVAHFRGSAFMNKVEWNTPNDLSSDVGGLPWGEMRISPSFELNAQISNAGNLQVHMKDDTGLPDQVIARWRCEGLAVPPISWSYNHA
jgi:hypothetical protein